MLLQLLAETYGTNGNQRAHESGGELCGRKVAAQPVLVGDGGHQPSHLGIAGADCAGGGGRGRRSRGSGRRSVSGMAAHVSAGTDSVPVPVSSTATGPL